jgi:HK97 gp10 family phage protein
VAKRFEVTGLRELGQAFRALDAEVQLKVAGNAASAGARVFKKRIAQLAPVADAPYLVEGVVVDPGNIGRNVIVKRLKASETPVTAEALVVVRGKRKDGYASRIGSLQEFGTVNQPPQPFFRPGAEQSMEPAAQAVKKKLQQGIEKKIKELSK